MTVTIERDEWDARHEDGAGAAPLPSRQWWLHHSATLAPDLEFIDVDRDGVDDDERRAMRTLEDIGELRFKRGISYTWPIMPSGRIYVGHSMGRIGAHTAGRNSIARAICFVGNYDTHHPTDAQLSAAAQLMVDEHRAGRATTHRLNGGHRDLKATACPGRYAYAAIAEINRRAEHLWNHPHAAAATPRVHPEEDVMYIKCQLDKSKPAVAVAILTGPMFVALSTPGELKSAEAAIAAGATEQWVEPHTWADFDSRSHAVCDNPRPVITSA